MTIEYLETDETKGYKYMFNIYCGDRTSLNPELIQRFFGVTESVANFQSTLIGIAVDSMDTITMTWGGIIQDDGTVTDLESAEAVIIQTHVMGMPGLRQNFILTSHQLTLPLTLPREVFSQWRLTK